MLYHFRCYDNAQWWWLSTKVYHKPGSIPPVLLPSPHSSQTSCSLHLTQESCFPLFYLLWEKRSYVRMATQSVSSFLSAHHLGRRMILDPVSLFHTFNVSQKQWLGFCQMLMFKSTWSPSGHSGEFSPIQRTTFLDDKCHNSDANYVAGMGRTRMLQHRRVMDFSASALAQHVLKHDHHIDWISMCFLRVESHYWSRLSREAIYICR